MLNFACSAHSRGLDTSNILVFATDQESKELAESVGLTAYHDHRVSSPGTRNAYMYLDYSSTMAILFLFFAT